MTFYRRRDPFASPLWQLLDRHYDEFKLAYEERYEKTYGYLRPAIGAAAGKFLKSGDDSKSLRGGSTRLSEMRRTNEDHRLHRTQSSAPSGRRDSKALRSLDRAR